MPDGCFESRGEVRISGFAAAIAVFIIDDHACREFLLANYAEIKKANPGFPVLIRECAGAEAKLVARFDKGVEKTVSIQGDSPAAIEKKLIGLTN